MTSLWARTKTKVTCTKICLLYNLHLYSHSYLSIISPITLKSKIPLHTRIKIYPQLKIRSILMTPIPVKVIVSFISNMPDSVNQPILVEFILVSMQWLNLLLMTQGIHSLAVLVLTKVRNWNKTYRCKN